MEFRRAVEADINRIMEIIEQAKFSLKAKGIDQWQNGYPNPDIIRSDIENNYGYVLVNDKKIIATVAVSFEGEKTYEKIYNGNWTADVEYAVVHRLAVDNEYKGRGIASVLLSNIEKLCLNNGIYSIRVDTHEDNIPMQSLLKKNNFIYCGIIYLEDKSKRLAYEKVLIDRKSGQV
ncbi:MAG: GNAT family N-acetyltransferase [Clostridiaceae bacterium]|nr:GNAT family N-acetyltransferase [Clostridiaceae bacterium]